MKKYLTSGLISLILLLIPFYVNAQEKEYYQALKTYIQKGNELFDMPGMAIGIYKDGKIVFAEGFGRRNALEKEKVDPETVFAIASCSKAFTAVCMAILVEEGKLSWTDKVIDHFPEFKLHDPYITREIEVQDLLSHRSGLQTFDGDLLWYGSGYSRQEIIHRIQFRENPYSFRSQFGYQNVMFIAAGELIKKVSGKSWDDFLMEKILLPIDMKSTSTTNKNYTSAMNVAIPHNDGQPMDFINYDNAGPAASMNSSVNDLLKWVELLLNHGTYKDKEIFSADQYYKLTSLLTPLNGGKGESIGERHFFGYGLGWFLEDYQGRKVIQHGGGLPGFHCKVVLVPEENLGFVVLANQISGLVEATYKKILDFYLCKEEKDWAQLYYDNAQKMNLKTEEEKLKAEASRIKETLPSLPLESYAGKYTDKMYGDAMITLENGKLAVELTPSKQLFNATLNHWHFDTFQFKFKDPFLPEGYVTFWLDNKGQPEYFTIDLENPDFHFYKLKFERVEK
ncbi:MAG: serine hydrolase [Bacteroidales bacterium]|nr:serine hydrolase [Bacteroidales bacterium]MCF8404623.1 serine hydrolase [Bacteroidales bacterium]